MDDLRIACATVAAAARHVRVATDAIAAYAAALSLPTPSFAPSPALAPAAREHAAAATLTLDAINFGSGWFPTLRKAPGRSGYGTVAHALAAHRERHGAWTAAELTTIDARAIAAVLDQDAEHPLMALYARSLCDLGTQITAGTGASFTTLIDGAHGSAVALARRLGSWDCFADRSRYRSLQLPFLKRAQIAAADLQRAGAARFSDLDRLTMFADNLVPHVLRLDGILVFAPALVARIEREELIAHDSPEEIEIRACAVHAVELIVAARPGSRAADVDTLLWERGSGPAYKAEPRHRCRCTAY